VLLEKATKEKDTKQCASI